MNYKQLSKKLVAPQRPQVIVVTGQMAAGKNYICSLLEKEGWKSVDADLLVHQAIKDATKEIYETFRIDAEKAGINLLNEDSSINRRALGQLVFANPELLKKQESIVYPRIQKMVEDFISQNEKSIINATVLFKTPELLEKCQLAVFVKAPFLKRLIRAYKRDKMPLKQIIRRFQNQKDLLKKYQETGVKILIVSN